MSETDTPIHEPVAPEPQPPVKKRGWPKGKPRGPRKPAVVEPEGALEAPIPPQPEQQASAAPKRRRRPRRPKVGVFVGKKFYSANIATVEDGWLKLTSASDYTWLRMDELDNVVFRGVVPEVRRPWVNPIYYPTVTYSNTTGTGTLPPPSAFPLHPDTVQISETARKAELEAHKRATNAELESMMGRFGVGS